MEAPREAITRGTRAFDAAKTDRAGLENGDFPELEENNF